MRYELEERVEKFKEAVETRYWLRVMTTLNPNLKIDIKILWAEAHELTKILSSIVLKV